MAFARAVMVDPRSMGAVAPSSRRLARAVVDQLWVEPQSFVVEVGCGTGALTEAVLSRGLRDSQYLGIEVSSVMIHALRTRFPSLAFLHASAEHIVDALVSHGQANVSHVVSSLPWTLLPFDQQKRILSAIAAVLRPGGQLLSYNYMPGYLLPAWSKFTGNVNESFSTMATGKLVWRNLPPAFTWRASNA